jgi:phosphoribosylaminoimidazolecarboxamide formyltransferase/IMP cyclohydrolase
MLLQTSNTHRLSKNDLNVVTESTPSETEINDLLFAWQVIKYIPSNAILIATKNQTVGIGAGQVSRIDAIEIALRKAGKNSIGAVLASDAFFPFRDNIDRLSNTGIRAIIQPGGSIRDNDIIAACNEHGISMVFTGIRCFKH